MNDDATLAPAREALERAIIAVGGPTAMGRLFDPPISHVAVIGWRSAGVPAERVLRIEQASGVSRHDLRPDIYPREDRGAAE